MKKDAQSKIWKWTAIVLIIIILAYSGYKGFLYGQEQFSCYIDSEVERRYSEQLRAVNIKIQQNEINTQKVANCAYITGYFANEMGFDCAVSHDYFVWNYKIAEKYLPAKNIEDIREALFEEHSAEWQKENDNSKEYWENWMQSTEQYNTPELDGTNGWEYNP